MTAPMDPGPADPTSSVTPLEDNAFASEFLDACRDARDEIASAERTSTRNATTRALVPERTHAPARLRGLVEVHPGVFVVRMLRPESCRRLLATIDERRERALASGRATSPPNSMHDHGFVLDAIGFGPLLADLRARRVAPIAAVCFPEFGGAHLDAHHGYVVEYARDRDEDLGFHADDSEVTLNLCLGDEFQGAELTMMGLRCDLHRQSSVRADETFEIVHEPGVAVLHAGRHRHRVEPIRRGRRRNLILWCRDSSRRDPRTASATPVCPPWCCHRG